MSVQVSYKKQIIFGFIILVIILASVEIIARIILELRDSCYLGLPQSGMYEDLNSDYLKRLCQDYKSIIEYELPIKNLEPNQHTNSVNINSLGFRGTEFSYEKDEKTFRIFVLGGSTLYGIYSTSDKTTTPGYLQEKFDGLEKNYRVEVINAGINGHDSYHETFLIKEKLIFYQPDLFIIYDGWNDLFNPIKTEYVKPSFIYNMSKHFIMLQNYYKSPEFFKFVDRVITKNIYGDRGAPQESIKQDDMEKKVMLWKNRWYEICELGKQQNFAVAIVLQPILGVGNKPLSEWESNNLEKLSHQSVAPYYPLMRDALTSLIENCDMTTDLSYAFNGINETIFYDLGHMGDKGNNVVATEIFNSLLPLIEQKLEN